MLCTTSKEVCSPQRSKQLFASLSLGISATLLWFCFQIDFCPCCLGICIYNVLIQEFHIQQMVFLARNSLCFLWAERSALYCLFSASHLLAYKWILIEYVLFLCIHSDPLGILISIYHELQKYQAHYCMILSEERCPRLYVHVNREM